MVLGYLWANFLTLIIDCLMSRAYIVNERGGRVFILAVLANKTVPRRRCMAIVADQGIPRRFT